MSSVKLAKFDLWNLWQNGYLADDEDDDDADEHDGDALLVAGWRRRHVAGERHRLPLSGRPDHDAHEQNVEDRQHNERQKRKHSLVHVAVADTIPGGITERRIHLSPLTVLLYTRTSYTRLSTVCAYIETIMGVVSFTRHRPICRWIRRIHDRAAAGLGHRETGNEKWN